MTAIKTFRLNNGQDVLAKENGEPMHYMNNAQAVAAVARLRAQGFAVELYAPAFMRCRYIVEEEEEKNCEILCLDY